MSKPTGLSEIVLNRFEDICPDSHIESMTKEEQVENVKIAFKIIGYNPRNFNKSLDMALEKLNGEGKLYSLCYYCWRMDE